MILIAVSLRRTNVPKPKGLPEERRVPVLTERKGDILQHVVSSFPDLGWKSSTLHWKHGVLATELPGKSQEIHFYAVELLWLLALLCIRPLCVLVATVRLPASPVKALWKTSVAGAFSRGIWGSTAALPSSLALGSRQSYTAVPPV